MSGDRIYVAGEPDPTVSSQGNCPATDGTWWCTWTAGHTHPQHVVGTGTEICAVWHVESEPDAPAAGEAQIREQIAADIESYVDAVQDLVDTQNGARLAFIEIVRIAREGRAS